MSEDKLNADILARLGLARQVNEQAPDWQKRVHRVQKLIERWDRENGENGEEIARKIDAFLRKDAHEAVRMAAVRALGRIHLKAPEIVTWEPFLHALADRHPEVQATTMQVLAFFVKHKGQKYLPLSMIETLWQKKLVSPHTNKLFRLSIIQLLGMLGMQIPAPALARLVELTHDADWQIREAAVLALGKLLAPEEQVQLSDTLFDENTFVRQAALSAIDRRASWPVAKMLDALEVEDSDEQAHAARALGEWGQPTAEILHALRELAIDRRTINENRVAAILALAQLASTSAFEVGALGSTDKSKLLNDPDPEVRNAASILFQVLNDRPSRRRTKESGQATGTTDRAPGPPKPLDFRDQRPISPPWEGKSEE